MYQPETYGLALLFMILSMLLGIVGQHTEALPEIQVPIVLLGLHDWSHCWNSNMRAIAGQLRELGAILPGGYMPEQRSFYCAGHDRRSDL